MTANRVSRTAAAILATSVLAALPAAAQQTDSDDTNVNVNPGAISIHDGLVNNFPTLALTGTAQKATAGMAPFEVRDLRGTGAGYAVTAQATAFAQHDGTAYVASGRTLPAGSLDYAGVTRVTAQGTDSTAPTADAGPFTVDSADGAVQVASAAAAAGMGIFDFASSATSAMTLAVPGDAYAASYRSDVTLSLVTGPAGTTGGSETTTLTEPTAWAYTTSMPTALNAHASATGADGYVYVAGGDNGSLQAAVRRLDPASAAWASVAPLNTARYYHGLVAHPDGSLYAVGGTGMSGALLNSVERYNPVANTWSYVANMTHGRYSMGVAIDGQGRIYAIGGRGSSLPSGGPAERYDPSTNTWTPIAPAGTFYDGGAAVGGDGAVYIIGGTGITATTRRYDPAADTWATIAPMPTARMELTATVDAHGRVYAIGGRNGTSPADRLATVERYDPSTGAWETSLPMQEGRTLAATTKGADGSIYALGGYTPTGMTNTVERLTFK